MIPSAVFKISLGCLRSVSLSYCIALNKVFSASLSLSDFWSCHLAHSVNPYHIFHPPTPVFGYNPPDKHFQLSSLISDVAATADDLTALLGLSVIWEQTLKGELQWWPNHQWCSCSTFIFTSPSRNKITEVSKAILSWNSTIPVNRQVFPHALHPAQLGLVYLELRADNSVLIFGSLRCFYKLHVSVLREFTTRTWDMETNLSSGSVSFLALCGLLCIWLKFFKTMAEMDCI